MSELKYGSTVIALEVAAALDERDDRIKELEALVEKMKRCENCLHGGTYCRPKIGLCVCYDKWEHFIVDPRNLMETEVPNAQDIGVKE